MKQLEMGFTLVETMVVVVMIGVLAIIITAGFRVGREHQNLVAAQQSLQSLIRDAQKSAFNEERSEACLATIPENQSERQRRCADVGLVIQGAQVRLFADTGGAVGDGFLTASDFVRAPGVLSLPRGVTVRGASATLLFRGDPPSITLVMNGQEVTEPKELQLQSGQTLQTLLVYPYGQLEAKNR